MDFLGGGNFTDSVDTDAGAYSGGSFVDRWLDCSVSTLSPKTVITELDDLFDMKNDSVRTDSVSRHELHLDAPTNAIQDSIVSIEKPAAAVLESPRIFQATVTEKVNLVVHGATRDYVVPVNWSIGTSTVESYSVKPGTAMAAAIQNVDSRLVAGKTKTRWTTRGDSSGGWVKDTNFWAADYNFSPLSPWNNSGGYNWAGTMISPCHMAVSTHIATTTGFAGGGDYFPGGQTVIFIAPDGTIVPRITGSKIQVYGDLTIIKLTQDIPASIGFFKVLPQNYEQYFPTVALTPGTNISLAKLLMPIVTFDQEDKGIVKNLYSLRGPIFSHNTATSGIRAPFSEDVVVGDSSDASLLLFNQPVFLGCSFTASYGAHISGNTRNPNARSPSDPNAASVYALVNAVMTTLGGGYQLTPYDFSAFPIFDTASQP